MHQQKKVVTIIVTYNGAKWIEKCLSHLLNSTYSTSIIVIDNQSTDNTVSLLQPFLPHILFIQANQNLGFGAANNIGIRKAVEINADYVYLLNQDAYVRKDCIEVLIKAAEADSAFGIISPMQLDNSGEKLDRAFHKTLSRTVKNIPSIQFNNYQPQEDVSPLLKVRFTNAAAWLLPINTIKKAGLFHPVFYHYGEDNNYAARVQYFGFKIGVSPITAVIHDRTPREINEKFLATKLRTFPLHTVLDIRKPFILAYLLGLNQLYRCKKKLQQLAGNKYEDLYKEQKKWFFEKTKEIKKIRKETKQPASF